MDEILSAFVEGIGPFPKRAVSVIGRGPGEAGLITVKGAVRLRQADIVFYDFGYRPSAMWNLVTPGVQRVLVPGGGSAPKTSEIADMIRSHVEAHRRVVYLTSGNPFVFERADVVAEALSSLGIAFEVIPGPTAALAAATYAGIPLTAGWGADPVCLAVGASEHGPRIAAPDLAAFARSGTLAVYVGEEHLEPLCGELVTSGLDGNTPATIVEEATRSSQRVISATLDTIAVRAAEAGVGPPAVVFVGNHAAARPELRWFDRRPLSGHRVLVTRSWHQSAAMVGRLNALGAEVVEAPTVIIEPLGDYSAVDGALKRLGDYDWLVLTSANGVDAMADRMRQLGRDARALAAVRIAAVGRVTADRLERLFITADLVPDVFVAEALAEAMGRTGLAGKRCLLLRSHIARKTLPDMLTAAGARCDDLPVYRTVKPDGLPDQILRDLEAGRLDWATFASASAFVNLIELLGDRSTSILPTLRLASIGPIVSKAMRLAGYEPTVEARTHTVEGLVEAIAECVTGQGPS
jgi:uroporphyrinogen III methyltransferase/synthase